MNKPLKKDREYSFAHVLSRQKTCDTIHVGKHILRVNYAIEETAALESKHSVKKLLQNNKLAAFTVCSKQEVETFSIQDHLRGDLSNCLILKQNKLRWTSSPQEWTSSMWIQAARLLLEISIELLEDGLELSEVKAQDIQFLGTKVQLSNPLTIVKMEEEQFEWRENKNFRNYFLNPIIRFLEIGIPFQQSLLYENGVEPESLFKEAGFLRSLTPSLFTNALVPSILNKKAKSAGHFPFFSKPTQLEVLEYRKNLYLSLQKELNRIEENNLIKTRVTAEVYNTYSKETENWLKEKINFYHPHSLLEINSQNTLLTKYACEIGIQCVSLQKDENLCDKNFRESKKASLNTLCVNTKIADFVLHSFEMVILNAAEYQSTTLQTYSRQDLYELFKRLTSKYLLIESSEADWGPDFLVLERASGFVFLEKVDSINVV